MSIKSLRASFNVTFTKRKKSWNLLVLIKINHWDIEVTKTRAYKLKNKLNLHTSVQQHITILSVVVVISHVKPEEAWCILSPMAEETARKASLACWLHTEQWLSSYWAIMKPGYGEGTAPPSLEATRGSAELLGGIWSKQAHRSSTPPSSL